jgi:hypothetical protein
VKKNLIIRVGIVLLLPLFHFAFAEKGNALTLLNINALGSNSDGYAEKVTLSEDVTSGVPIENMWVDVRYIRTTTVDCLGTGRIACLKGEVEISDLEIIL